MRRIASHLALLPTGIVDRPLLTLDGRRIVSIGRYGDGELDRMEGIEFYAGILIPGMVDAHCHLELSYLRGAIAPGGGFAAFAAGMARERGRFSDVERFEAMRRADRELWEGGVDAVGDIANGGTSFAVKAASRIRYRTFAEVFGLRTASTEQAAALLGNPATSATPHSTYSLQDDIFKSICRDGNPAPLSIHFMETPAEQELYDGHGALHDWYLTQGFECDFLHYGSPAERVAASVPRDRSVLLVHCCCVGQRDIDIIMEHFTAPVYWVLCPRSNGYISGLAPDTGLLRRNGLNVCVGTDSLASNSSLSMLDEMKALGDVPLDELLTWATRNGAAALGMGDSLGSIEEGRECGLCAISGIDYANMRLTEASRLQRIA